MTTEILNDLYIAREMLSREGRPQETRTNVPVYTWNQYCVDIGVEKRTANRWLKRHFGAAKVMHGANAPRKTWSSYCQKIGVEKLSHNFGTSCPEVN